MSDGESKGNLKRLWRTRRRLIVGCVALFVMGGFTGVAFCYATVIGVEHTGGVEFCGSCHSMTPMVNSYAEDIHGGMNKQGIRVECVDCHLPHDGVASYLTAKAAAGIEDVWTENLGNPDAIDWQERRKHKERYVYDSGCLKCHNNLKDATMANPKAFLPHRDYFMGTTKKKCVSCHENVGHKNLGLFLQKKNKE